MVVRYSNRAPGELVQLMGHPEPQITPTVPTFDAPQAHEYRPDAERDGRYRIA